MVIAYTGLAPFIVTLATLLGARGLLLAITAEGAKTYLVPRDSPLLELGRGTFPGFGWPVWIAVRRAFSAACCCCGPGTVRACTRSGAAKTRLP